MSVSKKITRYQIANLLIYFFVILVAITSLISIFFQKPLELVQNNESYAAVIGENEIDDASDLIFKNNFGTFIFTKNYQGGQNLWFMKSPREIIARNNAIEQITFTLKNLRIKKVLPKDDINMANFSFNNPLIEITLKDKIGRSNQISVGLINPIDDSAYILTNTNDLIYQVEMMDYKLEFMQLQDFIGLEAFAFDVDKLQSLTIYRGEKHQNQIQVKFYRTSYAEDTWMNKKNIQVGSEKVKNFIRRIHDIKTMIIIDRPNINQEEAMQKIFRNTSHTVEAKNFDGQIISYLVAPINKDLPDIKNSTQNMFAVSSFNKKYYHLITKESLNVLNSKDE